MDREMKWMCRFGEKKNARIIIWHSIHEFISQLSVVLVFEAGFSVRFVVCDKS